MCRRRVRCKSIPSAEALDKHAAALEEVGANVNNGLADVLDKLERLPADKRAEIEAESVSGDIEVAGDNQSISARLHSVSGDIVAENLSGELRAETVNGEINVVNGSFERISGDTVNGEIVFHVRLREGGRMDVETVNGAVDVDFGGDVSARFDIETFNGGIRNCFGPESVRTSKYAPGRELKFTEGSGAGRVSINTLNGGIRLCK